MDDLQALADELTLDRFHLVGTASGGIVAVDYALTYPERLRSLVIANSIVGAQDSEYLELGRRLRPPEFEKLPTYFKELGAEYRAANPQGVEQWIEIEQRARAAGTRPQAQPLRNRITFAALEKVDVPSFMLTGDSDLYSPPTVLKVFAARFLNAQFANLPAVGHSAFWEHPESCNRLVLDFIAKH